jgi:hypothetical protein
MPQGLSQSLERNKHMEKQRAPWAGVASLIVNDRFGGKTKLSELSGIKLDTIGGWINSGVIPEKYRPDLIALAKKHGIGHHPLDYVAYLVPFAA